MTHTMEFIGVENGLERWRCAVCGREFLMSWPPSYQKIILTPDDETVVHAAGNIQAASDPFSAWANRSPGLAEFS